MYYTDEFMDQWGADLDAERERAEHAAYPETDCDHREATEQPIGQIHYNGAVELYLVCDCGLRQPTGKYTSVL